MDILSLNNKIAGKNTYTAFCAAFTPVATPTDIFSIEGSATKTIYIWRFFLSTIQTTAGVNTWFLNKHSTANTGSTPVASARIPHDDSFPAAGALVQHYTATNPTPGTSLGSVATLRVNSPAPATAGVGSSGIWFDFSFPIILKGVAQGLALNFNGAALPPGLSVIAGATWTEQ